MQTHTPSSHRSPGAVIKSLTDPELASLLAVNNLQPYKTIFLLMTDAGLRINEAIQLNQSDLWLYHLPVQTLTLPAAITKNHQPREIPTSLAIRLAIQDLHDKYWPQHKLDPDTQAFFSPRGPRSVSAKQVQRVLSRISMHALHRHVTPHQLRHTFATRLMRKVPIRVVQALLGHTSLSSTQIYTTPNNTDLHDAIESLSTGTQQPI